MTSAHWATRVHALLPETTGRRGQARERIVDYLARHRAPLSAAEIADGLRAEHRPVGVASVYRTVRLLEELGVLAGIDVGEGIVRYEPVEPDAPHHHHHMVCDRCGTVRLFADDELEACLDRVLPRAAPPGFRPRAHEVVVHGVCETCPPGPPAAPTGD